MDLKSHGGFCCGMNHLHSFQVYDDYSVEAIKRFIRRTNQARINGMLVEVVLTNGQLREMPELGPNLEEAGFKLVSRFGNPNSRNICNVFHYNKNPRPLTRNLPYRRRVHTVA